MSNDFAQSALKNLRAKRMIGEIPAVQPLDSRESTLPPPEQFADSKANTALSDEVPDDLA